MALERRSFWSATFDLLVCDRSGRIQEELNQEKMTVLKNLKAIYSDLEGVKDRIKDTAGPAEAVQQMLESLNEENSAEKI